MFIKIKQCWVPHGAGEGAIFSAPWNKFSVFSAPQGASKLPGAGAGWGWGRQCTSKCGGFPTRQAPVQI